MRQARADVPPGGVLKVDTAMTISPRVLVDQVARRSNAAVRWLRRLRAAARLPPRSAARGAVRRVAFGRLGACMNVPTIASASCSSLIASLRAAQHSHHVGDLPAVRTLERMNRAVGVAHASS